MKKCLNFRFWPQNDIFFLETTCFWAEKAFEFPILAEKLVSISVKIFFLRPLIFGRKKRLNFRAFREIPYQFSDKPCETDSRTMKRSRSFALFSLFQKSPPLFQILATRLRRMEDQNSLPTLALNQDFA